MQDKREFNPAAVAIATYTYYPNWYRGKLRSIEHTDKVRGDLALSMISEARRRGYQIVIADWKSSENFKQELSKINGAIIIRRRSPRRSPSKRQAIRKARSVPGIKVIIPTEPEKVSLVKDCIPHIANPILEGKTDIVIPKRNDKLFKKTYPAYQYTSEVEGNRTYNKELRSHKLIGIHEQDFDMFFGPRAFSNTQRVVSLFLKRYRIGVKHISFPKWYFEEEELSNTNFFPIIEALKLGLKVKSVEVPFKYPETQKKNEDRGSKEVFFEKRKAQRIGLIVELLYFVTFLKRSITK